MTSSFYGDPRELIEQAVEQNQEPSIEAATTPPVEETPLIQPEVVQEGGYPAPFNSRIGRSTIDLSNPAAEKQMKDGYDEWWNYGKKR